MFFENGADACSQLMNRSDRGPGGYRRVVLEKVSVQQLLVYNIHQLLAAFSMAQPVKTKSRVQLYITFGNCVIRRFVVMYDCMVGQILRGGGVNSCNQGRHLRISRSVGRLVAQPRER